MLSEENLLGSASRTKKIGIVHIVDSSIQHFRKIAVNLNIFILKYVTFIDWWDWVNIVIFDKTEQISLYVYRPTLKNGTLENYKTTHWADMLLKTKKNKESLSLKNIVSKIL